MKKYILFTLAAVLTLLIPKPALAAGGIYISGGATKYVGETLTVTVTASGDSFNAFQGIIKVTGPVSITAFTPGNATWMKEPTDGTAFVGLTTSPTKSLTIATIKLKGTAIGSGNVSIYNATLAYNGSVVGTSSSNTNFSFERVPTPPGALTIASASHPNQDTSYEATAIVLNWNKPAGITSFSYLLDQSATTTPPAKLTSANTTVTYTDKAVGTYYFHLRAQNNDGWGATAHFKINIKEPDPRISETINQPKDIQIIKTKPFVNNIKDGTVSGLKISGQVEAGYNANITLQPSPSLPAGKTWSTTSDANGHWEYVIDWPIPAGTYKLTVQGQKDKTLTPISNEVVFQINQAHGGSIYLLSDQDTKRPVLVAMARQVAPPFYKEPMFMYGIPAALALGIIIELLLIILGRSSWNAYRHPFASTGKDRDDTSKHDNKFWETK